MEQENAVEPIPLDAGTPIREVIEALNRRLAPELAQAGEGGFSWPWWDATADTVMPERWRWIACYAVRGGSEGYWVHVDLITEPLGFRDARSLVWRRMAIGQIKVWTWDNALALANAATRVLHE